MDPRRQFNSGERAAMFLAAEGRCADCGTVLEPGWHADHIHPHSRDGKTEVTNGQALCPTCNLKKGSSVDGLRDWQRNARDFYYNNPDNFLVEATPGSGKTLLALTLAKELLTDAIESVIIVVPTSNLKRQWAKSAANLGIDLDPDFANASGVVASDYHGVATTYASVASQPLLWKRLATRKRTLIILDEIHHAAESEHLDWGMALREAFDPAQRRLLLSGTPFRSDGQAIPFVTYDNGGRCVAGYRYGYGAGLSDGVVRPIDFVALNSEVKWLDAGETLKTHLDLATEQQLSRALAVALDPEGQWIPSVIARADQELTRVRADVPDAGGLMIARDQRDARCYAKMIASVTGEHPTVVVSDDPDASQRIEQFSKSTSRWIVAVKMVSEGVDIPRLAVGVYATNIQSKMFVRQVVGRFVRRRGPDDDSSAALFIPSIQPLLKHAAEIESEADDALRESAAKESVTREPGQQTLFMALESTPAEHHSTTRSGVPFSDAELKHADDIAKQAGMPSSVTAAAAAMMLRIAGHPPIVGTVQIDAPRELKADTKHNLKGLNTRTVGRLARLTNEEHSHVNARANQAVGIRSIKQATVDQLQARLTILQAWLNEVHDR